MRTVWLLAVFLAGGCVDLGDLGVDHEYTCTARIGCDAGVVQAKPASECFGSTNDAIDWYTPNAKAQRDQVCPEGWIQIDCETADDRLCWADGR